MRRTTHPPDDCPDPTVAGFLPGRVPAPRPVSPVRPQNGQTTVSLAEQVCPGPASPARPGARQPQPYYSDDLVTIWHGDCREHTAWVAGDVLLTDPPYGIDYRSGSRRAELAASIANDLDTSVRDDVLARWGNRPALVFGSWRIPHPPATQMRLIWDTKGALGMGDLSIPWKPSDQEIYVLGHTKNRGFSGRRDSNVIVCPPVQSMARNGRHHPHEKPVPLLGALIRKCPAGVLVDPCAGSGSLGVAAKRLGRTAVLVELDERYCEIAARRAANELVQDTLPFGDAS